MLLNLVLFFVLGAVIASANGLGGLSGHHSGQIHPGPIHPASHHHSGPAPGSHPVVSSHLCDQCSCQEYDDLRSLENSNACVDENKVFVMLKALNDKSHACRKQIIIHLAGVYFNMNDTPSTCQCSGQNSFHDFYLQSYENFDWCWVDLSYDEIFRRYFKIYGGPISAPQCRTHHAIWQVLSLVSTSTRSGSVKSCQNSIIDHVGSLFEFYDPCSCTDHVAVHQMNTTTTTTTTSTTSTTTKQHPTATTRPIVLGGATATTPASNQISVPWTCAKLSTIQSIALSNHLSQQGATMCDPVNTKGSDEAFVLVNCNAPYPSMWKQGANVMQHCHEIPAYTPVATFIGGTYMASMAESGVFFGCINGGFKMGVQHCNSTPTIDHVLQGAPGLQNADYFYVIE